MKATYNIDPAHSSAQFSVRHMMISNVRGGFGSVKGTVVYDSDNPGESIIDATIDATTINTLDAQRDAHLKSADFFDVEKFPTLNFKSTSVRRTGDEELSVTGDLTIRGVTKSVTLAVNDLSEPSKDPWGNQRIGLSASAKVNRKDFGLVWNAPLELGGMLVGDEVAITLDVQFIKA